MTNFKFANVKLKHFGIDINTSIRGFAPGHAFEHFVPKVIPSYKFRSNLFLKMFAFWQSDTHTHKGMFIFGHAGSGKSTLPEQLAARLNIPVYRLIGEVDTCTSHLLGTMDLKNGNTVWIDGPLTQAVRNGGWFVLEEADFISSSVTSVLHSLIDGGDLLIPDTNEIVKRHETFAFFANANTPGSGSSETRGYVGTRELNAAFLSRFNFARVGYADADEEFEILNSQGLDVPEATMKLMIRCANGFRQSFMQGMSTYAFSTRHLISWLEQLVSERELLQLQSISLLDDTKDWLLHALLESLDTVFANSISDQYEREALHLEVTRNYTPVSAASSGASLNTSAA